ncbi:diacylglycerol kinase family lipid kinase [Oceanobacillus piezotolerans]|uniref:Diacylglycerol kinase family lipid kinase n=1 Tax=Oceanobacillus piezotolerans TaxID=2448030 RepID=A0A498DCF1_9BACI|nr:diacylglycerol kinase family protein [Oceanobacillus piezotolerans]RLL47716.1 diacylglycerol kinase family lipid kinase [Oceanobacillus piezotolerans]
MYIFIINPKAGNGRASRIFSRLKKSKLYQSLDCIYYYTSYPGHALEIARRFSIEPNGKSIIVIGGDGTIHEVVNGLGSVQIPVGFIPGGSGNDFARGIGAYDHPKTLFERFLRTEDRESFWIGDYQLNHNQPNKYVNSIGFGFDAQIVHKANHSLYKKALNSIRLGKLTYIVALIQVLIDFKPMDIELEIDREKYSIKKCWMVTIANHPYYGGGMKIIPKAINQPEKIPILIIHNISKWKVLALFLTVFKGTHVKFKEVEILEASQLTIGSHLDMYVQIDGETTTCRTAKIKKNNIPLSIIGTKSE